jgi:amidophosphoribosyltransferase
LCGIFGTICCNKDCQNSLNTASMTYRGLTGLQHRGQEAAGISVSNGKEIFTKKGSGWVSHVFNKKILEKMEGNLAIGHNRYGTTGGSTEKNAQPFYKKENYELALAHNGNLVNSHALRQELEKEGAHFDSTTDSEVITEMIARSKKPTIEKAVIDVCTKIRGAYSLLILTKNKIIAVRDPHGIRPLSLGYKGNQNSPDFYFLASETAAFNVTGSHYIREIQPGEVLSISPQGRRSFRLPEEANLKLCIFELIYLARPDSIFHITKPDGKTIPIGVHQARLNMGAQLAEENIADKGFDMVAPVPDSGNPAAIGFAKESKIPFGQAFTRDRYYAERTFINPDQDSRKEGVLQKLFPLTDQLYNVRMVLVEDSIVRGTTLGVLVRTAKEAGACEVHARISSPQYRNPCHLGIDTPEKEKLIAANMDDEEIAEYVSADSVKFLSLEGLIKALGIPKTCFCCACFDGKYPVEPEEEEKGKFILEKKSKDITLKSSVQEPQNLEQKGTKKSPQPVLF